MARLVEFSLRENLTWSLDAASLPRDPFRVLHRLSTMCYMKFLEGRALFPMYYFDHGPISDSTLATNWIRCSPVLDLAIDLPKSLDVGHVPKYISIPQLPI
jgi:hypothetical protein